MTARTRTSVIPTPTYCQPKTAWVLLLLVWSSASVACSGGQFESGDASASKAERPEDDEQDDDSSSLDGASSEGDDVPTTDSADDTQPVLDNSDSEDDVSDTVAAGSDDPETAPTRDKPNSNPGPTDATDDLGEDASGDSNSDRASSDDETVPSAVNTSDGEPAATCSSDSNSCNDPEVPTSPEAGVTPPATTSAPKTDEPAAIEAGIPTEAPNDECPEHPDQTDRGSCGCGFEPSVACELLETHLVHRYSFNGMGNVVADSVGAADGQAIDVELKGAGELSLNGDTQYVELPSGIASESNSLTLEAWVRWNGGDNNQRVFNFGTPLVDEPPVEFISLTPAGGNDSTINVSYRTDDATSGSARASYGLPTGSIEHLTVVFDSENSEILLYVGTELAALADQAVALEDLADEMNWLGRALYSGYSRFNGTFFEFRLYDMALDAEAVSQSDLLGDNATFSAAP